MKKCIQIALVSIVIGITVNSSVFARGSSAIETGNSFVSLAYGFPNLGAVVLNTYEDYNAYSVSGIGPIHLKYDYALSDKISLGVSIGYVSFKAKWTYDYYDYNTFTTQAYDESWTGSSLGILARFNYHFATSEKLDPYVGLGAGYNSWTFKFESDYPGAIESSLVLPPIGFEGGVGVKYFFSDNVGAYLELGYGKSLLQGGIAFKF